VSAHICLFVDDIVETRTLIAASKPLGRNQIPILRREHRRFVHGERSLHTACLETDGRESSHPNAKPRLLVVVVFFREKDAFVVCVLENEEERRPDTQSTRCIISFFGMEARTGLYII
jgi:hypothetical protein